MGSRRFGAVALCTAAALAAASASSAKDLCVTDSFNGAIQFKKVKSLKKPGSVVPLNGLLITLPMMLEAGARSWSGSAGRGPVPFSSPVVGTAATLGDGSVVVGVFVLGPGQVGTGTGSASLRTDQNLAGNGAADRDGDFSQDEAYTWTAADCDSLPFP